MFALFPDKGYILAVDELTFFALTVVVRKVVDVAFVALVSDPEAPATGTRHRARSLVAASFAVTYRQNPPRLWVAVAEI